MGICNCCFNPSDDISIVDSSSKLVETGTVRGSYTNILSPNKEKEEREKEGKEKEDREKGDAEGVKNIVEKENKMVVTKSSSPITIAVEKPTNEKVNNSMKNNSSSSSLSNKSLTSKSNKMIEERSKLELLDFINHVAPIGTVFIKHGNHLFPHIRKIYLLNNSIINYSTGMIPLYDIIDIASGKSNGVFTKISDDKVNPNLCFSIISKNRTLDLEAANSIQRDLWVAGLKYALELSKAKSEETSSSTVNSKIMVKVSAIEGKSLPPTQSIGYKMYQSNPILNGVMTLNIPKKTIEFDINSKNEALLMAEVNVVVLGVENDSTIESDCCISLLHIQKSPLILQFKSTTERDEWGLHIARAISYCINSHVPVVITKNDSGTHIDDDSKSVIPSGAATPNRQLSFSSLPSVHSEMPLMTGKSANSTSNSPALKMFATAAIKSYSISENVVTQGEVFLKYGRMGAPHERRVFVDITKKELSYTSGVIKLSEIISVRPGKTTEVLKNATADSKLCFSILTKSRSLDLECKTKELRDIWVESLLEVWTRLR